MVMMAFSGTFIECTKRWVHDFFQQPLVNKDFQGPVNGGNIEFGHGFTAIVENFLHAQWSLMLFEYALYGLPLYRKSFQKRLPPP